MKQDESFENYLSWKHTTEFVASLQSNKYALYSLKQGKFITNYIFDKITYIPNDNYFVIKKSGKVQIIDTKGKVLDMKVKYPDNFNMEALSRFRNSINSVKYFMIYLSSESMICWNVQL